MNRLIIVGNGFDLAHGLETSYCDFLDQYLTNVLEIFRNEEHYDDPLLKISFRSVQDRNRYPYNLPIHREDIHTHLTDLQSNEWWNVTFKSNLLEISLQKSKEIRWVDLENDFFDELLACVDPIERKVDDAKLATLNNQFGYLKNRLEEYLQSVQFDLKTFQKDPVINRIFREKIDGKEVVSKKMETTNPVKTMFLNFNYTNTLTKYAEQRHTRAGTTETIIRKDVINHIHGELSSLDNKIVFGFGDEYDDEYLKFENLKNNELFRHIKSFAYFKTRNYHDLIRFINDNEFQVFIIGHSCGLSDRTMFRKIFEHPKCLSIKIFYHNRPDGSTDFVDKTYDLARHFTDKGMMRDKLVSEPLSSPLPQYDKKLLATKKPILR